MIKEELYIIENGDAIQLDLSSPSGITLNYVSNLFNDLSKIDSSYSYTFKLPRTAHNCRILDIVDNICSAKHLIRMKSEAEYRYNGVTLFSNANLYITGVDNANISAVLTWNVNKGLQSINDHDMSLNELGKHLPDGEYDYKGDELSEYETDKVILIDSKDKNSYGQTTNTMFTKYKDYSSMVSAIIPVSKVGAPFFQVNDENQPIYDIAYGWKFTSVYLKDTFDEGEDATSMTGGLGTISDAHRMVLAVPSPVVPVPYLMGIIGKVFGLTFNFSGGLYNSLGVPLVTLKPSDALCRINYVEFTYVGYDKNLPDSEGYYYHFYFKFDVVNNYPDINPISMVGSSEMEDNDDAFCEFSYNRDAISYYSNDFKLRFDGCLKIYVYTSDDNYDGSQDNLAKLVVQKYIPSKEEWVDAAEVEAMYCEQVLVNSNWAHCYYVDFSGADGYDYLETEAIFVTKIRFRFMFNEDILPVIKIENTFKMYYVYTEMSNGMSTNLFANLPDISCLEFIKAVCYALGGFPYMSSDDVVSIEKYSEIYNAIMNSECVDWSKKIVHALPEQKESFTYDISDATSLSLAQTNYFLMKNDSVDDYGNEAKNVKTDDAYEHGYYKLKIDNDLLDKFTTLFTFPFYGGFLWSKDFPSSFLPSSSFIPKNGVSYDTGTNQDIWKVSDHRDSILYYTCGEAKPMLAVITPIDVEYVATKSIIQDTQDSSTAYDTEQESIGTLKYASTRIWNCATDMKDSIDYEILKAILSEQSLVKEDLRLDVSDLASLDILKPVYLEKYNSLFAIKKIEVSSSGTSKVELFRLPVDSISAISLSDTSSDTSNSSDTSDESGGATIVKTDVEAEEARTGVMVYDSGTSVQLENYIDNLDNSYILEYPANIGDTVNMADCVTYMSNYEINDIILNIAFYLASDGNGATAKSATYEFYRGGSDSLSESGTCKTSTVSINGVTKTLFTAKGITNTQYLGYNYFKLQITYEYSNGATQTTEFASYGWNFIRKVE